MSAIELYLYFCGSNYILIVPFALVIFKEDVTILRWLGIVVICVGVFLVSRS